MIKTIIFDAFGTLFKVRNGASANTIVTTDKTILSLISMN